MKKTMIFAAAFVAMTAFVGCGNKTAGISDAADSTKTDSIAVVDSVGVVDSVAADSTVTAE